MSVFSGNIFISRKSISSCDECDEDDGLTTSAVYKIGEHLLAEKAPSLVHNLARFTNNLFLL